MEPMKNKTKKTLFALASVAALALGNATVASASTVPESPAEVRSSQPRNVATRNLGSHSCSLGNLIVHSTANTAGRDGEYIMHTTLNTQGGSSSVIFGGANARNHMQRSSGHGMSFANQVHVRVVGGTLSGAGVSCGAM